MDSQSTAVLLFCLAIFGWVVYWALNQKSQPRKQMSLEAQRAYERKKGEMLAEQNYNEAQIRQQKFQQQKRNVARNLNKRHGSLF